jgi:hypothetical protein
MSSTDRDIARRYLVTVGAYPLPDEPQDAHLSVLAWNSTIEAWLHGQAICGRTVPQGEMDTGVTVTCPDCLARQDDYERMLAGDDELTVEEAREEVQRLGTELYEARDRLAFVGECCDIADREGRQPTTADVRAWLQGPQCARQAGLVIDPPKEA